MKKLAFKFVICLLSISALPICARAGSLTNNFATPFDYIANGIIGDTNWDGVYLNGGDVPGGSGSGTTIAADAAVTAPGFLSVQGTGGAWVGGENDSFFIYKVVSGDFDASVEIAPPFDSSNYHLPGLMARAYNPNNSGAAYSATSTNSVENWVYIARFQEFSLGEHGRYATNGADVNGYFDTAGDNTDTNSARYLRLTRTGDVFTFYNKTNQSDAWNMITNLTRSDLAGVAMQVGIKDESGTGNRPTTYFTDFELSGTNISFPAMPAAPSALITTDTNTSGSLTFSWTLGNPGDSSLVVMRAGGSIQQNPVQGVTYSADATFGNSNTLLSAAGEYVVYNGAGNSVTVTNLAGVNVNYSVAVYEYANPGAPVYNTAAPATNGVAGPGALTNLVMNISPTNLPAGGVAPVQVLASLSTGGEVDVTTNSGVTLTSSDLTVVSINNGILNGLQTGAAQIIASYLNFSVTNNVTVIVPRFTDNFSVSQDYLNSGLPGSTWDGIYDRPGDVPGGNDGGDPVSTTAADANISSNNTLTVSAAGTTWEGASDDGFFLFKKVPGDFQAVVHVDLTAHGAYQFAGLLARAANQDGGPYLGSENYVANWFFDQFSVVTSDRQTINGNYQGANDNTGSTPANMIWLLLQRVNGTNFYCYSKFNATDPWTLNRVLVQPTLVSGVPVQIGLAQSTYTSNPARTVRFDSFMLDGAGLVASGVVPPSQPTNFVMTLNPDVTMNLSWDVPGTNSDGTAIRSLVIMRAGAPVSAQPYLAFGFAGNTTFGDPSQNVGSGNYVVFRSAFGDTNTHQSVTISGLSPGVTYYAAVYTFVGLGGSRTFNTASQDTATNPASGFLQDGVLIGLQSHLAQNGIPLGGVGIPIVEGIFTGGGLADITPAVTVTSDDTNIVLATNNVLTGVALGSATATITYSGFTNVLAVTVRNPNFTDGFGVSHDYLADGVTNTTWDGVYMQPGDVPDTTFASAGGAATIAADANISSNNVLSVTNVSEGFEFAQNDGFFLFKYVPGDFQMSVNLLVYTNNDTQPYNNSGLLARGYTTATNGTLGAPLDQSGRECWVSWTRFDEFGIGTRYEVTVDNSTQRPANSDANGPDRYMLMARVNSTNFYFFQRSDTNSPWHATSVGQRSGANAIAKFASQPMQVGLDLSGYSGTPVDVGFSEFMLDAAPASPAISVSSSGGNINLSWPASSGFGLQSTLSLAPSDWQTVTNGIVNNGGTNYVSFPETNANMFFRLIQ